MEDVTYLINAIEQGDPHAVEELLPLVYQELRILAAQKLSNEPPGQTLQATALVHEAYLRLVSQQQQTWSNRGHFFSAAAEAMRRILVENARRKKSLKHGGNCHRISLSNVDLAIDDPSDELIALDEALTKLAKDDGMLSKLIELRYFAGLTNKQAADILCIPPRTADSYWAYARAWLYEELKKQQ